MNNLEKLKEIIEYAENNGYDLIWLKYISLGKNTDREIYKLELIKLNDFDRLIFRAWSSKDEITGLQTSCSIPELLFDKDFAKRFFGEWECQMSEKGHIIPVPFESSTQIGSGIFIWQYYLQKAVILDNIIDYYYNYIKNESNK